MCALDLQKKGLETIVAFTFSSLATRHIFRVVLSFFLSCMMWVPLSSWAASFFSPPPQTRDVIGSDRWRNKKRKLFYFPHFWRRETRERVVYEKDAEGFLFHERNGERGAGAKISMFPYRRGTYEWRVLRTSTQAITYATWQLSKRPFSERKKPGALLIFRTKLEGGENIIPLAARATAFITFLFFSAMRKAREKNAEGERERKFRKFWKTNAMNKILHTFLVQPWRLQSLSRIWHHRYNFTQNLNLFEFDWNDCPGGGKRPGLAKICIVAEKALNSGETL